MTTITTFTSKGGPLLYSEIDDNFTNLNNSKIERVVTVNDGAPAITVNQSGAGESIVVNTSEFVVDENGDVGIGTANPRASLDVASTDAIILPSGTTAQRVDVPGAIRYNTATKKGELFSTRWNSLTSNLNIDKITTAGYNGIQIFGENEIYFTSGNNTQFPVYTNGRTNNYPATVGLDEFQRVVIPTTQKIIDAGSVGHHNASYALCENGDLYTWGNNSKGTCGLGTIALTAIPTLATTNVTKVFTHYSNGGQSVDEVRMLILKSDGYLYGAGYNGTGSLGLGTTAASVTTFTQLTAFGNNIKNAWNLGTGYGAVLVQRNDNTLWIAGSNNNGFFGNGTTTSPVSSPVNITSNWLPDTTYEVKYVGFTSGYYDTARNSSCILVVFAENSSGQQVLRAAGSNQWGSIGNGTTGGNVTVAYNVTLPKTVKQVSTSGAIPGVFVLYTDSTLVAWGFNENGMLGTGNLTNTGTPTQVLTDVKSLPSLGFDANTYGYRSTSFAVKNDGSLWSCGYAELGQCANGINPVNQTTWSRCIIPTAPDNTIKMIAGFTTVGTGSIYVAVREDNEIFGWGHNGHYGVQAGPLTNNFLTAANFKIKRA